MNNNQEEKDLIAAPDAPKTIVQSAKNFMNGVLSPLKGKDLGVMVEDFTAEMTLVAEGLSEDQQKLSQETQRLSAQQTELEQRMLDSFHDSDVSMGEMRREIASLRSRLEKAEKVIQEKKLKRTEGLTAVLRQATWLAAIAGGAWILVTLIHAFT